MTVIDWNQYKMRRDALRNGGPAMSFGSAKPTLIHPPTLQSGDPLTSAHIRIDCLHRYVKAQLLPRSTK